MFKPALPLAVAVLGVTGTLIHAAAPKDDPTATIEGISWSYGQGESSNLRFKHDHMHSSFDASELPEVAALLAAASSSSPGEAVSFSLARDAGALTCAGHVTAGGGARGTCRFDPSEAYVAALAIRGLYPDGSEEMLALALIDARIAEADGLERAGFDLEDADDLMTVAALDVTVGYAAELKGAGLAITELEDLVAARALDICPDWLREMAEAGFPNLTVEQATTMRALDVTPDYARRMRVVARTTGELM